MAASESGSLPYNMGLIYDRDVAASIVGSSIETVYASISADMYAA